jgi:hypothetical protein
VTTVRFTPDDAAVLVLVKGSLAAAGMPAGAGGGMLLSWALTSARTATLSTSAAVSPLSSGGGIPFSVTDVPGRRAFLSADAGVDVFDYARGLGPGRVVRRSVEIPGQIATCWSTYSEASGSFYVADILVSTITEISVGQDLMPAVVRVRVGFGSSGARAGAYTSARAAIRPAAGEHGHERNGDCDDQRPRVRRRAAPFFARRR